MADKRLTEIAKKLGRRGGLATLKKHGRAKMREWGKRGGRPKESGRKSRRER